METRNLILAIVLSVGVLLLWTVFIEAPRQQVANQVSNVDLNINEIEGTNLDSEDLNYENFSEDSSTNSLEAMEPKLSIDESLKENNRITIDSNKLSGSINLTGLSFDDIVLKDYKNNINQDPENVRLLAPKDTYEGYGLNFGWYSSDDNIDLPDSKTEWKIIGNKKTMSNNGLLEFEWINSQNIKFLVRLKLIEDYLINVEQSVINNSEKEIKIIPISEIKRKEIPELSGMVILHEGAIGYFEEDSLVEIKYSDSSCFFSCDAYSKEEGEGQYTYVSNKGWLGLTDKYWQTAIIPEQNKNFTARFEYNDGYIARYYENEAISVLPSENKGSSLKLFIGPKESKALDEYEEKYNIYNFSYSIDWGMFYFLTKPLFSVIYFLYQLLGNFGLAIIALTVIIRIVFFPLANWSFVSMAKMKMLQPEMTRIKELYKEDRPQQQKALMDLYKKEKVNPISGCLPILIQIPFFFAIYKMLFVSIEMRHAPFYGWIQDLAAKDPTSIFNMFGLIPWDPPSFLIIGVWPVLMGLTMYIQQKLNPAPPDPIQAKIFMFFPLFITILLAQFAAGLVIYWTTNNLLSIIQQWVITRRTTVKTN